MTNRICPRCKRQFDELHNYKKCDSCRTYSWMHLQRWRKDHPNKTREYNNIYRTTHIEKIRAYDRERERLKDPQKKREKSRKWRKNHPEEAKEHATKYRKTHPERAHKYYKLNRDKLLEHMREYKKQNSGKVRMWSHNRRARKKGNGGAYTIEEEMELFALQEGKCHYCGVFLYSSYPKKYHIDHKIPISRGGSNYIDNIVLACPDCNQRKYIKTEEEFLREKKTSDDVRLTQVSTLWISVCTEDE